MTNKTQLERYKKLISYIDENFKEDINIQIIEEVCHYSYRNINRIFEALHHETIGKYIKRLRLEKAAQYLKYSETGISDIAFEVGFEERASFNKAFKKKYGCSPTAFRASNESVREMMIKSILKEEGGKRQKLQFEIEYVPDFEFIFLEHRGDYEDSLVFEEMGNELYHYMVGKDLL
ncbi:MAG: AraC family transcriptional regulator, partial [Bacteroidota bacterium]